MIVWFFSSAALAETEEAKEAVTEEEDEPLLGFLDYLLLLAIAGIGYWWFFMRDNDSDKIPEVRVIFPMILPIFNTSVRDKADGGKRDNNR